MKKQNPPKENPPTKADKVAFKLMRDPGEWYLIHEKCEDHFFPWWGPIYRNKNFETKIVRIKPDRLFGPCDVYARYVGDEEVK